MIRFNPSSWKYLVWLFIIVQLIFTPFENFNYNTSSRFAAMEALCNSGTFEITPYHHWDPDWSRTPDGRYFSNKAPGGLFVGAPLYCAAIELRKWLQPGAKDLAQQAEADHRLRFVINLILSLFLQMLPWIWICKRCDRELERMDVGEEARLFAAIALLFGTTPSIMMDVWIGHPLAAFFSLLALLAIFERQAFVLGLALGMMQLMEYSSVLLFPAAFLCFWQGARPNWRKKVLLLICGAGLPAILWTVYHDHAFGGIFQIANKFINPIYRDELSRNHQFWGIITLPDSWIFLKLLFGWQRGILFSQPWVLFAFGFVPFYIRNSSQEFRWAVWYCLIGLLLLLLMNASFGGWHGGGSAGPRYLSAGLPIFVFPVALGWNRFSKNHRKMLWWALGFSCVVFVLAKIWGPTEGLWPDWRRHFQEKPFDFEWKFVLMAAVVGLFYVRRPASLRLT